MSLQPSWLPRVSPLEVTRSLPGPSLPEGLTASLLLGAPVAADGKKAALTSRSSAAGSLGGQPVTASSHNGSAPRRNRSNSQGGSQCSASVFVNGCAASEAESPLALVAALSVRQAAHAAASAIQTGAESAAGRAVPGSGSEALPRACSQHLQHLLSAWGDTAAQPSEHSGGRNGGSPAEPHLFLQPELVAAVLMVMDGNRAKRLASTPALLLLPAAEFGADHDVVGASGSGRVSDIGGPGKASAALKQAARPDAVTASFRLNDSALGGGGAMAAMTAEAVDLSPQGTSSGRKQHTGGSRPPMVPAPKILQQGTTRQPQDWQAAGDSSSSSMVYLGMSLFLSQAWRSVSALGASATLVMAPAEPPSSSSGSGAQAGLLNPDPLLMLSQSQLNPLLRTILAESGGAPSSSNGPQQDSQTLAVGQRGDLLRRAAASAPSGPGGPMGQVITSLAAVLVRAHPFFP